MDVTEQAHRMLGVASGMTLTPEMAMSDALRSATKYSGDAETELVSSVTWARGFQMMMGGWACDYRPDFFRAVLMQSVTGKALKELKRSTADTPEAMLKALTVRFKQEAFQVALFSRIHDGSAFKGVTHNDIIPWLTSFAREFTGSPVCLHALVVATKQLLPDEWKALRVSPDAVSFDQYHELLLALGAYLAADADITPSLFGKAAPAPVTRLSAAIKAPTGTVPRAPEISSGGHKNKHSSARHKQQRAHDKATIDELQARIAALDGPSSSAGNA
ncbi:hypothetical protein H4R19_003696 [Coemansia spiralis]|nr:hypothetical protein H4R19_003696 [Coemansia spiralis]